MTLTGLLSVVEFLLYKLEFFCCYFGTAHGMGGVLLLWMLFTISCLYNIVGFCLTLLLNAMYGPQWEALLGMVYFECKKVQPAVSLNIR